MQIIAFNAAELVTQNRLCLLSVPEVEEVFTLMGVTILTQIL